MKKAPLYIGGTVVFYFVSVLVLFIFYALFKISYEYIWLSAIPTTIIAELLLLADYLWKKHKKRS